MNITQSAQEKIETLLKLHEITKEILSILNASTIAQLIVDRVCELMQTKDAFLVLFEKEDQIITPTNYKIGDEGIQKLKQISTQDFEMDEIKNGKIICLDERSKQNDQFVINSGFLCPLMGAEETMEGILILGKSTFKQGYTKVDLEILTLFCEQASIAIQNAHLFQHAEKLAFTDGLTGVSNHRYFKNRLELEVERAHRYNRHLSLIIIDIDHFKEINDTYGHLTGDLILKAVANLLKKMTRNTDLIARYGGDEFTVFLPETPKAGATRVVERIFQILQQDDFATMLGLDDHRLTLSVGVATLPTDAQTSTELLKHADEALYLAKKQGRNCYVVYNVKSAAQNH